ncbi:Acetyltransferase (GNAT) family protein [compost metagenome]
MEISFAPAVADDFEELLALRIAAMHESLLRIGRFDPARARERFLSGFSPADTRYILLDQQRTGFVVLKHNAEHILLDHLYIHPDYQGRGIGSAVLTEVFRDADVRALPLHVGALRASRANHFYRQHGFVLSAEEEWDVYYIRQPASL